MSHQLFSFSKPDRQREFDSLDRHERPFDLAIVGGGVTGAAIARDATLRGLSVVLLEKNDFASGTSSRSTKLVHGGVRYLEHGEFKLVAESTRERALLWKLAPELVHPLAFLFPAYTHSRVPLWKLNIGLWLYDLLAMGRTPTLHRKLSRAATERAEAGLLADNLSGSIFYWDGSTNDALLTLANIVDAVQHGAVCLPRVKVEKVDWDPGVEDAGPGHTLHLRDELNSAQTKTVRARVVISATGPWTDWIRGIYQPRRRLLATTRGSHIVVPAAKLPTQHAVVLIHPKDERVLFSIPWMNTTILGTTDIFDREDPDGVAISSEEVDYLIDAGNHFYPRAHLQRSDVISTWSGLRPLLAPPENASESEISREHHIEWVHPGLLVIAGGKLTTHREMAEQALDRIEIETKTWRKGLGGIFQESPTRHRPLPSLGVDLKGPLLPSEERLREICRTQMVISLEDLLVRRTDIFYRDPSNGLDGLPRWKSLLQAELGWSNEDWMRELQTYRAYVRRNVWAPLDRPDPA